jgi:hypothetical protein
MPIDPKIEQPTRTMLGHAMRHKLEELAALIVAEGNETVVRASCKRRGDRVRHRPARLLQQVQEARERVDAVMSLSNGLADAPMRICEGESRLIVGIVMSHCS